MKDSEKVFLDYYHKLNPSYEDEETNKMTESQKETLRFYTTNDYLLINGLLWGESKNIINAYIDIINQDGLAVMKEATEIGYDVRWGCSKEDGEKLYQIYQQRFPIINSENIRLQIIERAKDDITNMMSCLEPLATELMLYRNIKTKFVSELKEGTIIQYLGFSSCSLNPHTTEDAMYGSSGCTLVEIMAPIGTPAIRLDLMPDVQNEPDEVILAPVEFLVTKVDKETGKIYMTVKLSTK